MNHFPMSHPRAIVQDYQDFSDDEDRPSYTSRKQVSYSVKKNNTCLEALRKAVAFGRKVIPVLTECLTLAVGFSWSVYQIQPAVREYCSGTGSDMQRNSIHCFDAEWVDQLVTLGVHIIGITASFTAYCGAKSILDRTVNVAFLKMQTAINMGKKFYKHYYPDPTPATGNSFLQYLPPKQKTVKQEYEEHIERMSTWQLREETLRFYDIINRLKKRCPEYSLTLGKPVSPTRITKYQD